MQPKCSASERSSRLPWPVTSAVIRLNVRYTGTTTKSMHYPERQSMESQPYKTFYTAAAVDNTGTKYHPTQKHGTFNEELTEQTFQWIHH